MNEYGNDMNPNRVAGELAGITSLVDAFDSNMDTFPQARVIRNMHPDDLTESREKLTYFLWKETKGSGIYFNRARKTCTGLPVFLTHDSSSHPRQFRMSLFLRLKNRSHWSSHTCR